MWLRICNFGYKQEVMTISDIQLYQLLKNKLGEKEAEQLVSFVKGEVDSQFLNKQDVLVTTRDLDREISRLREDMIIMKAELLKTIYVVGLIQFLAIVGSLVTIANFMLK